MNLHRGKKYHEGDNVTCNKFLIEMSKFLA